MGSHSRFSPSATEREYTCPGSFLLNEKEPDHQSSDAAHGTAAHHVGELCLRTGQDVEAYAGCTIAVDPKGNCRFVHELAPLLDDPEQGGHELGFEVDDEMVAAVQDYVDQCRALPGTHFVEVRVEHTDWCPDLDEHGQPLDPQFGTSDHIACIPDWLLEDEYKESTLVVTDLKYGKGVKVFAFENKQAIKYALGTYKKHNPQYKFKRVVIRISQPRLGHFDTWELSVEELLEWGQKIKRRLELVFVPDPPFEATEKGCKFCKVSGTCRHLHEFLRNIHAHAFDDLTGEMEHDPKLLTETELMQAYYASPLLKLASDAIEREVYRRVAEGTKMGRLKLVESRTDRVWRDEEAARAYLRKRGLDDARMIRKKFLSPAQAEASIPRALWPEMADLYMRPPGRPVLVDETDSRPEYGGKAVAEMFDSEDGF